MLTQSAPAPAQAPASAPPTQFPQPFMVQVAPPPSERDNLKNVFVGSFGLTGALILAAVIAGCVLAGLWIVWRKWRRTYDSSAPPTLGPVALGTPTAATTKSSPTNRPTSPDQ